MRKLLLAVLSIISLGISAQQEFSSFTNTGRGCATAFATDYQAVGINPANLGWDTKYQKRFTMGFAEFTGSVFSDSLSKDQLRNSIVGLATNNNSTMTHDEKVKAVSDFTQSGFAINADMGSFGFAAQIKKVGGFAFRINDHFQWYSKLGAEAANLIFMGKTSTLFDTLLIKLANGSTATIHNHPGLSSDTANMVISGKSNAPQLLSKILDGSRMNLTWYREYNLSYGRKIIGWDSIFAVYGGVGVKYIQGMAMLEVKSEGGHLSGFSSLSPQFGVNYGTAVAQAHEVAGSGFPPKSVGAGYGFDFGANIVIKKILKIGASLINVGSINWTGNVYQLQDTLMVSLSTAGAQNLNMVDQLKNILGPDGVLKVKGQESRRTDLPGMVRAGASIQLGKYADLGCDFVIPITSNNVPGTLNNPLIGIGGDLYPVQWLRIQAGFITGGNYSNQVPVGISFVAPGGVYEAGIASRDAITFFTQHGPTLSLSTGFIRMRF